MKRKEGLAIIHRYMLEQEIVEEKAQFGFFCGGICRNFLVKPYHNQDRGKLYTHQSKNGFAAVFSLSP